MKLLGHLGLFAATAATVLGSYTLSLRVAAERRGVERVETAIASSLKDIRALEAELRTRARLPQLERWNNDVLAMAAPGSKQFAADAMQLAAYAPNAPAKVAAPAVMLAVGTVPVVAPPVIQTVAYTPAAPVASTARPAMAPAQAVTIATLLDDDAAVAAQPAPVVVAAKAPAVGLSALGLTDGLADSIERAAAAERSGFRKVSMR